jgi:hypothetical protein
MIRGLFFFPLLLPLRRASSEPPAWKLERTAEIPR